MLVGKNILYYHAKSNKLSGDYSDIEKQARRFYNNITRFTKRNPYIKSAYFHREKIFIKLFWTHLFEKHLGERRRRLKYYLCAIELLRETTYSPETKQNPNGRNELVHRFAGIASDGSKFYVQVKEDNRSGNKHFISIIPERQ